VAEMRAQSKAWNLAADAGMLLFLKQFSQRIISKTYETGKLVCVYMYVCMYVCVCVCVYL
jgi:hypothetical protein